MRILVFLILSTFVISCASSPPRNKSNACLLLYEKDEWLMPLKKVATRWAIPEHTILAIMFHESRFIADARPPRRTVFGVGLLGRRISSAYGYSQALDGTWKEYMAATGNWSARRTSFSDSADFIGWYLNRSVTYLNISPRNAYDLYLSYHQGIAGFRRGSYKNKPAIKRYAKKVQATAIEYKSQIDTCPRYASL